MKARVQSLQESINYAIIMNAAGACHDAATTCQMRKSMYLPDAFIMELGLPLSINTEASDSYQTSTQYSNDSSPPFAEEQLKNLNPPDPVSPLETLPLDDASLLTNVDPTNLWSYQNRMPTNAIREVQQTSALTDPTNTLPSRAKESSLVRAQRPSAQTISSGSTTVSKSTYVSQPVSQSSIGTKSGTIPTLRARYAANQRYSKSYKARRNNHQTSVSVAGSDPAIDTLSPATLSKNQYLRKKNNMAAARFRSRQRKQVQSIREKGKRLGKANTELKALVNGLKGELNGLRTMALGHDDCGCRVARYNCRQAERVIEGLNAGAGPGTVGEQP